MIKRTIYRADGSYKMAIEVPDFASLKANMAKDDVAVDGLQDERTRLVDGTIQEVPIPEEQLLRDLRFQRDRLLAVCDWTQVPDAPLTAEQREAWRVYRQALRDMPETTEDPAAPIWPTAPAT